MKKILSVLLTLTMVISMLTGCGTSRRSGADISKGGTLLLKVNPEIAITYDENGNVTNVESRNEDAQKLLESYTGYEGRRTKDIVKELVTAIGDAGYFVEEIEGERKQIVIEIEKGSAIPSDTFIDDVVGEVKTTVKNKRWYSPVDVMNETDYGMTDYIDTDYGEGNDGITDYIDTDYGPENDGVTDYNDTDYGYGNDGVTDYVDTDYGLENDGVTDYIDSNYGNTDYGTPAEAPKPVSTPVPEAPKPSQTDYDDPASDYGDSNYGSGNSGYDSNTDYDSDSDYDD